MNYLPLLERVSNLWSGIALRATIDGGILLLFVALVCFCLPRLSSTLKCWLWRLALLKLVLALAVAPFISIPLLPTATPVLSADTISVLPPRTEVVPAASSVSMPQVSANSVPSTSPKYTLTSLLFLGWLAGAGILSGALLLNLRQCYALRKNSIPANPQLQSVIDCVASRFSLTPPSGRISNHITIPLITGFLRPLLLLPTSIAETFPDLRLKLICAHELAHLRRHDLYWNLFAALVKIIFWFHPLLWLAVREIRLHQEIACDQLALRRLTGSESDYGQMLLDLSSSPRSFASLSGAYAVPLLHSGSPLKRRLAALKFCRAPRHPLHTALATCLVGAATLSLLPWQLTAQDEAPANEPVERPSAERGSRSTAASLEENTREQQRLYEQEIALAHKELEVAERHHKAGAASASEVIQLQRELARIERELAHFNNDLPAFKASLETEINLVESLHSQAKQRYAAGVGSNTEVLKYERELLRLKRELASAENQLASTSKPEAAPQILRPIQLSPARAGIVTAVSVTPGQPVKAGQVLLKLDDRESRLGLKVAEANLAAAEAAFASAEKLGSVSPVSLDDPASLLPSLRKLDKTKLRQVLPTVHRDATLEKLLADLATLEQEITAASFQFASDHPTVRTLVAQYEKRIEAVDQRIEGILTGLSALRDAREAAREELQKLGSEKSASDRKVLRAELQRAQANVEQARLEMELYTITSPVDGTVDEILLQPGERATPERPVFLLIPDGQ